MSVPVPDESHSLLNELDFEFFEDITDESEDIFYRPIGKEDSPQSYADHTYESLDYDAVHNKVHRQLVKTNTTTTFEKDARLRWVVSVWIALAVALVAFCVGEGVLYLQTLKDWVTEHARTSCDGCFWFPFLTFCVVSLFYTFLSALLIVFVEPLAGGSGIPEVKCYLNGLKIPNVTRLKTLMAKAIGISLAVAAGLVVGKEGVMLHSGAIVAAGLSQGASVSIGLDTGFLKRFRSDAVKRDFVTGGVAAGVAAGFGAPIGGVMFTLEEGASHWNQALTWRTFFCATICMFFLNFLMSCEPSRRGTPDSPCVGQGCGFFSQPGLITFGSFQVRSGWTIFHLPFFLILGALCGTFGAAFVSLNKRLSILRRKYITKWYIRISEALLLTFFTCCVRFIIPYFIFECFCASPFMEKDGFSAVLAGNCAGKDPLPSFHSIEIGDIECISNATDCTSCEVVGSCYADSMALLFATHETAIRALFHWDQSGFSFTTLFIAFAAFWLLGCISQGAAVPSGIFIPSLLIGAVLGRIFGEFLLEILPQESPQDLLFVDPGMFALIGAVSFLAGVTRATISLTVMMMEATNDVTYGLPIMMTVMMAKWVGDMLSEGMFDLYIDLNRIPFLGWEPPSYMGKLTAKQVMKANVVQFREVERVGFIYDILMETTHNGFPVVNENGKFVGFILRSQLITMLRKHAFSETRSRVANYYTFLGWDDFLHDYPRVTPLEEITLHPEERLKFLDLTPYMQLSPYSVHPITLLDRVFTLFRTMGLRHLTVVDVDNQPIGIITRKDLVYLEESSYHLHRSTLHLERSGGGGYQSPLPPPPTPSPPPPGPVSPLHHLDDEDEPQQQQHQQHQQHHTQLQYQQPQQPQQYQPDFVARFTEMVSPAPVRKSNRMSFGQGLEGWESRDEEEEEDGEREELLGGL